MALIPFSVTVIDHVNNPNNTLANEPIEIRTTASGNPLASIFADEDGLIPIAQPGAVTDAYGVFNFYADSDSAYNYIATAAGQSKTLNGFSHNKTTGRNAVGAHDAAAISTAAGGDVQQFIDTTNQTLSRSETSTKYMQAGSLIQLSRPLLFAHRGLGYSFENTISEYSYAMAQGADGLEVDIQFTSDGYAVLFHDDTLDAKTSGTGLVSSYTLAQLQALTFPSLAGTIFEDERIPLFEDLLKIVADTGCWLIAEVKTSGGDLTNIDNVTQLCMDYGVLNRTFFGGFITSFIDRHIAYNPDINILYYRNSWSTADFDYLATLANTGAKVLASVHGSITQSLVGYGRNLGIASGVFTTTQGTQIRTAKRAGANIIVTDVISGHFTGVN